MKNFQFDKRNLIILKLKTKQTNESEFSSTKFWTYKEN